MYDLVEGVVSELSYDYKEEFSVSLNTEAHGHGENGFQPALDQL